MDKIKEKERINAYLKEGDQFKEERKLDQAIEQYQQALQLNPNLAQALAQLAEIYETRKELDSAINCLQKLVQLKPNNNKFFRKLMVISSKVLAKKDNIDDVIATYHKVLKEAQSNQTEIAHKELGQTLHKVSIRQGQFDRVVTCFQELIEVQPNDPWLYYNLALNLARENQLDQAVSCYRTAIQLNPEFWQALIELGKVLDKKRERDQAFQCRIKALQIRPDLPRNYLKFWNPHSPEEWNLMKNTLQENLEKTTDVNPGHYLEIGRKHGRQGEFLEAIRYYQQLIHHQLSQSRPEFVSQYWDSGKLQEPNFLIIGVAKCGTTSLYDYLSQHPQFLPAIAKELNYLNRLHPKLEKINKQRDWSLLDSERNFYLAHFPPRP